MNLKYIIRKILDYNPIKVHFIIWAILFQTLNPVAYNFCLANSELLLTHKIDLTNIENYLNNIKYLDADFVQESDDGNISQGKLLLSRPGKLRVEYKQPSEILIIVNGSVLTYFDIELDEMSYLRTNSTPASFLTRKNFSFWAKDVYITNFIKQNGSIKVSLMKKNKKEAGEFSLIFDQNPLKFTKMEVKNSLDELTKVSFIKSVFDKKLSNNLFIIKNKNLPE